jgi:hypothetical protein
LSSKDKLNSNDMESKPGTKYVRMVIDFWYNENDGSIHITHGDKLHTTINDKDGSIRKHQNMFNKLRSILEENGKWPSV